MAEIRDGAIRDVLQKLRRLSYEIEEASRRFDTFAYTSETLYDVRIKIYRNEAEIVELPRQVGLDSTPSPLLN